MTRDDWQRAEPILTQALFLPEADREALLESANLGEALRRDLMELLRRSLVGSASVALTGPVATLSRQPAVSRLPPLTPGAALASGRYVVVRQIGRGGMGTVFLGHDTTFGTLVALKVMPYDERLLAEARRAAVCSDHPHVATIHNVLKEQVGDQELGVLVMEYVAGTPASRLLDDGPVDVGRVLKWGRQVAAAIDHAHNHQVLHCDLKPANIVITEDGRAKVLDFGISRATFDTGDPAEPVRGTMPYMAPEQLLSKQFSPAGDIYSLGVTLFELVTGRLPFDGDDDLLRLRILAAPPPNAIELVADIPPELQSVLERAMAKEPEKRFRSARSFERALEGVETGVHHTTGSVPVPAVTATPSIARRAGWAVIGWVAAILVSVLVLGAFTSSAHDQTLERAGFSNETVGTWLMWGRRASIGPLIVLGLALLGGAAVRFVWRLTVQVLTPVARLDASIRRGARQLPRRLGVEDIMLASIAALLVSIAAFATVVLLYKDLFPALTSFAANGKAENLALLSPEYVGRHSAYRRNFSLAIIAAIAAWYPILRSYDRLRVVPRVPLMVSALIVIAALILLHHPYRLMFSELTGHGVEAVRWQENYCYILGQRGSDTLLLCPDLHPPRHRIVRTGDTTIVQLGVRESVFRGFYRQVERTRGQSN